MELLICLSEVLTFRVTAAMSENSYCLQASMPGSAWKASDEITCFQQQVFDCFPKET